VHLYLAEQAFAERDRTQGNDQLDAVELRAELAIESDPLLVPAYIALARRHEIAENYDEALRILNDALDNPELKADVNLLVERGEVYFQQGEIDLAAQEAYTALYIDPTVEDAYLLQIKTALAQGDPGLAVIYAQNYLFFYPGSAEGYKLLGDARIAEGNVELALTAYDQALAAEDVTGATLPALLARAQLAMQQRRYDQARQDYTEAFELTDDPAIRAQRMQAAFLAGNTGTALTDAENLQGTGVLPDSEINLLRARILIDNADEDDTDDLNEALGLLNNSTLPVDVQPIGDEYQARAQFLLGNYSNALSEVDTALAAAETGSRRFLRGQVLEALERPDEAIRDYEWVLAWSEIYAYPFVPQARSRMNALLEGGTGDTG
jgi:tetratricopeptide (TPR) repeat protein